MKKTISVVVMIQGYCPMNGAKEITRLAKLAISSFLQEKFSVKKFALCFADDEIDRSDCTITICLSPELNMNLGDRKYCNNNFHNFFTSILSDYTKKKITTLLYTNPIQNEKAN